MGKGKGRFVLVVLTAFILLGAGSAGAIVWGLGRVADEIRTAPGFAAGWAMAAQSPTLTQAIGTPRLAPFNLVEFVAGRQTWLFTATHSVNNETTDRGYRRVQKEHDQIEVPILGPRGSGSLAMEAVQTDGGAWEVKKLEARVGGRAEAIDLLKDLSPAAAEAPKP